MGGTSTARARDGDIRLEAQPARSPADLPCPMLTIRRICAPPGGWKAGPIPARRDGAKAGISLAIPRRLRALPWVPALVDIPASCGTTSGFGHESGLRDIDTGRYSTSWQGHRPMSI